ncbi:hypothetical protein niasHT_028172 [Heterodera trifolii]|uniref:Transposase n=1 Tax=Heterodera trifolii TaxID=157864 RepID=A0ABD2JNV6_9BILA
MPKQPSPFWASSAETRRKRKEWRQEHARKAGSTPKRLKQTEDVPTADGEGPSTQAAESGSLNNQLRTFVSQRRNLAEKIVDVIDRDRSRSVSRCSLQTLHREVRHKFGHYTPMKKEQLRTKNKQFMKSWAASAVTARNSKSDNLINFRSDELILKLSGDNGQGFTNWDHFPLPHVAHANSPANNFIVAAYPAKDTRENLSKFCGNIWQQINQLNEIGGKKIKLFLGGDLSFLWALTGHCGSAVTTFPSPVCDCRRDQLLDAEKCKMRHSEETAQTLSPRDLDENWKRPLINFGHSQTVSHECAHCSPLKPKVHLSVEPFCASPDSTNFGTFGRAVWRDGWKQLWKTCPTKKQMRSIIGTPFVQNWLLTRKIDEMKRVKFGLMKIGFQIPNSMLKDRLTKQPRRKLVPTGGQTNKESDGKKNKLRFE